VSLAAGVRYCFAAPTSLTVSRRSDVAEVKLLHLADATQMAKEGKRRKEKGESKEKVERKKGKVREK
jgi:hypothetical protein